MLAASNGAWTPYWWLEPLETSIRVTPIWYWLLASMMAVISESNTEVTPVPAAAGAAAAGAAAAGAAAAGAATAGAAVGASAVVDDGAAVDVVVAAVDGVAAGTAADGVALAIADTLCETDERACAAE